MREKPQVAFLVHELLWKPGIVFRDFDEDGTGLPANIPQKPERIRKVFQKVGKANHIPNTSVLTFQVAEFNPSMPACLESFQA